MSHEAPTSPDLRIDTDATPADEGAVAIYRLLVERGFVADPAVTTP